jgi:hypothetical protein
MSNRGAAALLLLVAVLPVRLRAQVGYDPAHSPFQEVTTRQTFTPLVGQFFGNRANAGVGAQAGPAIGGRFTTALSGALELWATLSVINSRRSVIDPTQPESTRTTGPVDYRLVAGDIGIALKLTGSKTYHGFAPYVGAAFGVVAPTSSQTDASGYKASSHIVFVPTIGTQLRIGRVASLTVEARDYLMRYEWPASYFGPAFSGTAVLPPVLDPATETDKQMSHNFVLSAGLSLHFNF